MLIFVTFFSCILVFEITLTKSFKYIGTLKNLHFKLGMDLWKGQKLDRNEKVNNTTLLWTNDAYLLFGLQHSTLAPLVHYFVVCKVNYM